MYMASRLSFFARPLQWFWRLSRIQKAIIILLVLGIGYFRYQSVKNGGETVETKTAHKGTLEESVSASGEVNALEVANLAFQTGGKLAWVGVKEGDYIKRGQAVASLDKSQLALTLKKALNTYEKQFTTFNDTSDSADDVTLNESIARLKKRAQVDLDQTVIDVEIQQETLRLANLYSPITGIVTKAQPSVAGTNVGPTTASYQIVNPDTIYFDSDVNEVDIIKLKEGTPVEISLNAYPDEILHETIHQIGFASVTTSSGGTAYKVQITLPNNDNMKYRLGMNGDAKFVLGKKENVLLIPSTAIVETEGKSYVWTITPEKTAHRIEIQTGSSSIDETEITEGLSEGDIVINRPGKDVVEGVKIKQDK